MIIYPLDWANAGRKIETIEVENTLLQILREIDCNDLSFSGGIDSSLLLYYLLKLGRKVRTFTWASEEEHPDIIYSHKVIGYLEKEFNVNIERCVFVGENGNHGDLAVAEYYSKLSYFTDSIITGDGIDEFMAGYYAHQAMPCETVYYDYLYRLQNDHLIPLNENSGRVKVYIPYIDKRLIHLLSQIPLSEKVDCGNRKKVMGELAQGKLPQEIIERKKYGLGTPAMVATL